MKEIATKELALLFFIPFLVAVVHAAFAFKALQNITDIYFQTAKSDVKPR